MPIAWRNGDFSALLDPAQTGGKVIQLYNPYSLDATTGLRAPFPNNVIPSSLLNSAAVKLLNNQTLYPAPQYNRFIDIELLLHQSRAICTATRAT